MSGAGLGTFRSRNAMETLAVVPDGLWIHSWVYHCEPRFPGLLPTEGMKTSVPANPANRGAAAAKTSTTMTPPIVSLPVVVRLFTRTLLPSQ